MNPYSRREKPSRSWNRPRRRINHALGVLYLDATTAAPSDTWEGRGKTMEVMSQITYDLLVNDENDELLSYLEAHADELDAQTKREVEVLRKSYDQIHRIPA